MRTYAFAYDVSRRVFEAATVATSTRSLEVGDSETFHVSRRSSYGDAHVRAGPLKD